MLTIARSILFGITIIFALTACGGGGGGGGSDDEASTNQIDPIVLDFVLALFTTNGDDWNDYLAGSDFASATDTACNAAANPACIHGGEHRMVLVTGRNDCIGLTASDDLGAFNWVCDNSIGTARMISTGLADGMYLSDLIDFTAVEFREMLLHADRDVDERNGLQQGSGDAEPAADADGNKRQNHRHQPNRTGQPQEPIEDEQRQAG